MSNPALRKQVIELRLKGYTYGQIRRELGVSKSTLSDWLSKMPLNKEQLRLLLSNRELSKDLSVEKYRLTRERSRLDRLKKTLEIQNINLLPLNKKELFIAGLFLYWGEGDKRRGRVSISNTDPKIVKFGLYWMTNILKIPKERVKVLLHLYQDMDIKQSIDYWSNLLEIPLNQFSKPYLKKSNRSGLTYKSFGFGTCRLHVSSVELSEKIAMSIKAISEEYGAKSDIFWYN